MENVMVKRILGLCAAAVALIGLQARGDVAQAAEIKLFTSVGTVFGPEATKPPFQLVASAANLKFNDKDGGPALIQKARNALTIGWIKAGSAGTAKTTTPDAAPLVAPAAPAPVAPVLIGPPTTGLATVSPLGP